MTSTELKELKLEISATLDSGVCMGDQLAQMMASGDLSNSLPTLIQAHGALCMDIEYGAEIPALARFKPGKIIVSEPLDYRSSGHDPFGDFTGQAIQGVIQESGAENVRLVRDWPSSMLDKIKAEESSVPFGLITLLNAFPKDQQTRYLAAITQQAMGLLAPGGEVVISTVENDSLTENRLDAARLLLDDCGLSAKLIDKTDYGKALSAGRLFLICQKK